MLGIGWTLSGGAVAAERPPLCEGASAGAASPLAKLRPPFPQSLLHQHPDAEVVLRARFSTDGRVSDVAVCSSSGQERLDNAALRWATWVRFSLDDAAVAAQASGAATDLRVSTRLGTDVHLLSPNRMTTPNTVPAQQLGCNVDEAVRSVGYPREALAAGWSGYSEVFFELDTSGKVVAAFVWSRSDVRVLDRAAAEIAWRLRCSPQSSHSRVLLPIDFRVGSRSTPTPHEEAGPGS